MSVLLVPLPTAVVFFSHIKPNWVSVMVSSPLSTNRPAGDGGGPPARPCDCTTTGVIARTIPNTATPTSPDRISMNEASLVFADTSRPHVLVTPTERCRLRHREALAAQTRRGELC